MNDLRKKAGFAGDHVRVLPSIPPLDYRKSKTNPITYLRAPGAAPWRIGMILNGNQACVYTEKQNGAHAYPVCTQRELVHFFALPDDLAVPFALENVDAERGDLDESTRISFTSRRMKQFPCFGVAGDLQPEDVALNAIILSIRPQAPFLLGTVGADNVIRVLENIETTESGLFAIGIPREEFHVFALPKDGMTPLDVRTVDIADPDDPAYADIPLY